jgi:two-component system CheB/CheR fusion protein
MMQRPEPPASSSAEASRVARDTDSSRVAIVGIGASAGGLEALKKFLAAMPRDSGMAFVLVPHLDPAHESLMVPLLARCTAMPVLEVTEGMRAEANHVYVIPPGRYLGIRAGALYLTGPFEAHPAYASLDWFLRSLAQDQQEHAICIILSGTGSHGALGLRAIKANSGAAFAQDPATAQFPQMPQRAIATGLVDGILPVEHMPEALIEYSRYFRLGEARPASAKAEPTDALEALLALLAAQTRLDFRGYRRKTVVRRIERRMRLTRIDQLSAYLAYAREHLDEVERLGKDLLISVTHFFRDPEAFQALATTVIHELVRHRVDDQPLRVWVPGCTTGEEAYSIAMLLLEQLAVAQKRCPVKIFASDVDEEALAFARAGLYPETISGDVSPTRLERFFSRVGEHSYQVSRQLRESVVVTSQNLLGDPPFSRLDLISCRNLFIYLEQDIQEKIVLLFHSMLTEGGYLLLGSAEAVGRQSDLFEPISAKWRIYRRLSSVTPYRVEFPIVSGAASTLGIHRASEAARPRHSRFAELTQRLLLEEYVPASVLVNRGGNILYFHGSTLPYLDLPSGEPTHNVLTMAREGLRTKLRAALRQAARDRRPVRLSDARIRRDDGRFLVRVTVKPLAVPQNSEELFLVSFEDVEGRSLPRHEGTEVGVDESLVRQLEFELAATREELAGTVEEIQSANEELQSSNEELETSKEELQSLNEELSTTNVQLQERVDDLEQASNDMSNLLSSTDTPTLFLDTDLCIKWFTPASTKLFSLLRTDIGRPLADIAQKFTDPNLLGDAHQVLRTLIPADKEVRSSEDEWWLRRIRPYRTADNRIEGVVVLFGDVTAVKQAASRERRFTAVLMDSNDAITVLDLEGRITAWNLGAERMYGYSESEALQMNIQQLIPEAARADELIMLDRLRNGQLLDSRETRRIRKDGTILEIWVTATTLRGEDGRPSSIATTDRDVTELKTAARIQQLAAHDPLTGLPNRVLLVDLASRALAQAQRNGTRVALLFLDLDRFKTVNDSLGHQAGDRLLHAVAERLKQCVRAGDTVVRHGGDEFIVILSDIASAPDVANIAEKIRHAMAVPYVLDGLELVSSASIGVSLYPDDAREINMLIKNSDAAMYRAKLQGRNTCQFFTPDMNVGALERLSIENSLRGALGRHELRFDYQPQVDLATGQIIGVEALMRWEHPDLGAISPAKFIPLAEECGLIVPLGEWGLLEACRQARAWQEAGLPEIPVAVNLTAAQFHQPNLVRSLANALEASALAASALNLEITESVVMHNVEAGMLAVKQLRALGLQLSIDDFGTGYSSLSYLRRFPIQRLKIDVSFMRDLTTDPGAAAITNAIIALGKGLHLRVLAEGVETREQLALLRAQGCNEIQGYFFSRPLPPDQLAELLQEGRTLRD